ncbi:MAG: YceI family protein [Chitinophagaceae bacterium]
MKKIFAISLLVCLAVPGVKAQTVYQTKSGKISFFSSAPLEDIRAVNNQVDAKLATNGQVVFMVAIKGFRFPNATMQDHFNEDYLESTQYPKAIFMGTITNLADVHFDKDGLYNTTVTGELNLHGVKQKVTATGTIGIKAGKLNATSVFKLKLLDYNVKGAMIGEKIAKEIEVTVDCHYD